MRALACRRETEVTAAIRSVLAAHGIWVWKQWQGPMSSPRGVSDLIGIAPGGRFLAVEVKTERGRLSAHQERFLEQVRRHGGIAFVARSMDDAIDLIRSLTASAEDKR